MDGDGSLGLHVGPMAMKLAIQKAKQFGIGCVIVKNAGHLGGAGYHTSLAAKEGCIGQVMYQYKISHRYKSIKTIPTLQLISIKVAKFYNSVFWGTRRGTNVPNIRS